MGKSAVGKNMPEKKLKIVYHLEAGPWLGARIAEIAERENLDIAVVAESDVAGFEAALADVDVLLHTLVPVTARHIANAPSLRLIQKVGVGVNTIDLEAARARLIPVCNMPGSNSRAVMEATLLLMLACLRRLPYFETLIRRGEGWNWPPAIQDSLGELSGRTVGLAGYGTVPTLLAPVLVAMGARVIYASRSEKPGAVGTRVDKATLLSQSDILSLHMPLTDETSQWLDREALGLMKPGAILVNTARGGLVDEAALVAALRGGHLRGAGLDVFEVEPVSRDNPLLSLDNVVLVPHLAYFTVETLERGLVIALDNINRLREGRELVHRVA
jgi:phosphoglycerate dehydrogenase-like enzyme